MLSLSVRLNCIPANSMRVGLFVTCLVDLMRPSIGFAAIKLLEAGGAEVFVPPTQTCCGQPGYNSGDRVGAAALAAKVIAEFEDCDYLVAPSGSCSGMIRTHYADLSSATMQRCSRAPWRSARKPANSPTSWSTCSSSSAFPDDTKAT